MKLQYCNIILHDTANLRYQITNETPQLLETSFYATLIDDVKIIGTIIDCELHYPVLKT